MSIGKSETVIYIFFGRHFDICAKAGKQGLQVQCTKCRAIIHDKHNLHVNRNTTKNRHF